ncbi:MAG: lipid-A-disaccharide synthase [Acidobacteriota bacterium]
MGAHDLLVVAGEASGDLHGARLLSELRLRCPELRPFGLGSDELRAAGLDSVADSAEISVVGIVEVLKIYRRAKEIFDQLLAEVERRGARTAVLVDFPDFNLRLAKQLHRRGVRVLYYISPQVWAWRKGRVKAIARDVDRMLVLFPFEVDFYRGHGVDALHVGHPLVDEVPSLEQAWSTRPPADGEPATVALLPGSRRSEVAALLPSMLGAVERLAARRAIHVRLIEAPTIPSEHFETYLADCQVPIERIRGDRFQAVADSHLALCASGTATVEVGLLGTPMLVLYRLATTSYYLAKWLVDLPHFCMVNLVLGRGVVPELLQHEAEPQPVADAALALLADPERIAAMRAGLAELRPALGDSGASERAAEAVLERLAADEEPAA